VDVEQGIELRLGGLLDQRHVAVAGVVDQVIEGLALPGLRDRGAQPCDEIRKAADLASIELQRHGLAAERGDLGHGRGSLAGVAQVGQHHVAALAGDVHCHIAAETAAATGDDRNRAHCVAPLLL
jgi:hypothetical protein